MHDDPYVAIEHMQVVRVYHLENHKQLQVIIQSYYWPTLISQTKPTY